MKLRSSSVVLLTSCVVLVSGCQPEQVAVPAPTIPPPPPEPAATKSLAIGFTGLYFTPGQPLVLSEGSSVFVDINWISGDGFPQNSIPHRVVSDAPAAELSVTPSTVEIGPGTANADAILLTAVSDDRVGEAPATYTIEVQALGPLECCWVYDFSRAKMEVTVVEAESPDPTADPFAADCSQTGLQAVAHSDVRDVGSWMRRAHGEDLIRYFSGEIRLRASHPQTALTLLAPYRRPFAHREVEGDPPFYRPYPFGFLFDLALRDLDTALEQTMTLAWFDDLHLRLETPGCDTLEAICEGSDCRER